MEIFCHDFDSSSATVAWEKQAGSLSYEVQILQDDGNWRTLSDKLQGNYMLKKNLLPATAYSFRGRSKENTGWTTFGPVLEFTTLSESDVRPAAPKPLQVTADAITVTWQEAEVKTALYEVNLKEEGAARWTVVSANLKGTAVRKKNLNADKAYLFRFRIGTVSADNQG